MITLAITKYWSGIQEAQGPGPEEENGQLHTSNGGQPISFARMPSLRRMGRTLCPTSILYLLTGYFIPMGTEKMVMPIF